MHRPFKLKSRWSWKTDCPDHWYDWIRLFTWEEQTHVSILWMHMLLRRRDEVRFGLPRLDIKTERECNHHGVICKKMIKEVSLYVQDYWLPATGWGPLCDELLLHMCLLDSILETPWKPLSQLLTNGMVSKKPRKRLFGCSKSSRPTFWTLETTRKQSKMTRGKTMLWGEIDQKATHKYNPNTAYFSTKRTHCCVFAQAIWTRYVGRPWPCLRL